MYNKDNNKINRRLFLRRVGTTLSGAMAAPVLAQLSCPPAQTDKSAPSVNWPPIMKELLLIPTWYYQQFDADFSLDVPAEGYGGWHRAVEYIPRAPKICNEIFPKLLPAVRASKLKLYHVVGGGDYYKDYPGYKRAVELAGPTETVEKIEPDPVYNALRKFKHNNIFVGAHN